MDMFRELNGVEEAEFRQWARNNYAPGDQINQGWHPVVRDEINKINDAPGAVDEDGISTRGLGLLVK